MQAKFFAFLSLLAIAYIGLPLAACAQEDTGADPLQDIASEMNSAATQLGKLRTGDPTQAAQQNALKKLEQLIATLEQRLAAMRGGAVNPNSTRPATESVIRSGPGGMGKLHAERRDGKQWAELPAKERERILQSLNEGFPSHYQVILERYFARLAGEEVSGTGATPGTGAASAVEDASASPASKEAAGTKDRP